MDKVIEFYVQYGEAILAFVGAFAVLATATPNKTDNKIVDTVLKLVNLFGANFGKAANKED